MAGLHNVIIRAVTTEKSETLRAEQNVFVFEVAKTSNKVQIRQAIEAAFGVKVLDVRTLRVRGKYRRFGARSGLGSEWKKAYVRVADGQTPNFQ